MLIILQGGLGRPKQGLKESGPLLAAAWPACGAPVPPAILPAVSPPVAQQPRVPGPQALGSQALCALQLDVRAHNTRAGKCDDLLWVFFLFCSCEKLNTVQHVKVIMQRKRSCLEAVNQPSQKKKLP